MNENENDSNTIENTKNHDLSLHYDNDITKEALTEKTILLAMEGDEEAFSSVFMSSYRYVYAVSKNYLNNDDDIYDAIQETYTKVYANIKKLKEPTAFLPWIGKISENVSKDILSSKAKINLTSTDDEAFLNESVTVSDTSDTLIDITEVFSQLSHEDAELLTYIYYDGFKVTDVARMQGIAKTTVYSRLNAAKSRLKNLLKVRGIEKPMYGGDLVALITTTIRNSIGTNVLSAAVAEEILQSVTGKNTKAGVVISKVAKAQRNTAVLRIASFIVLIAMLTTCVTALAYFGIRHFISKGNHFSKEDAGSISMGKPSPNHNEENTDDFPTFGTISPSDSSSASATDTFAPQNSPSPTPIDTSAPQVTLSVTYTPTEFSFHISSTPGITVPFPTFPMITTEPVGIPTPTATPMPTVTPMLTSTPSPTSTPITTLTPKPSSTPAPAQLTTVAATLFTRKATIHNGYIYYYKVTSSLPTTFGIFKAKTDGSGSTQIVHNIDKKINKMVATDDYLFYYTQYNSDTALYRVSNGKSECIASYENTITNINVSGNTLYIEFEFNDYYKTNIDTINLVKTEKDYSNWCNSPDGTKTYYRVCKKVLPAFYDLFEYDSITGTTRLITANNEGPYDNNDLSSFEPLICGNYMLFAHIDSNYNLSNRLVSLDNPNKTIRIFDPAQVRAVTPYNGGTIVFQDSCYSIATGTTKKSNISNLSFMMIFPNEDYLYFIDDETNKLCKILPDGTGKMFLE